MYKGGRPRDIIWEHFVSVTVAGKEYAKCKLCDNQQLPKACRLKLHYVKCSAAHHLPAEKEIHEQPMSVKRPRFPSLPPTKRQAISIQPDMDSCVVKTSLNQKNAIDLEIAKFFYACNIPFNAADHPQYKKMMSTLQAGYQPPNRKQIAGNLLDTVYDQLQEDMKHVIGGKTATLVQDGWSNCHNEPIIASCLQVENKSYLLDSHPTGSMSKTGDNCKMLCQESITKAKENYNCTVSGVCTDNAKNMEKMRAALQEDDPDLTVYGCSAHWLNLLGLDLTSQSVMKHVVEVQKYFRNHHKPCAWLSECAESKKPQLPGETRWKSQLTCLDSYIANRASYMKIVQDHEDEIDQTIAKKIQDINIYRNAKDMADLLRPVAHAIGACQADYSSLASACHTWLSLLDNPNLQSPVHKTLVTKRFKQAIIPEHFTAYKLHPAYQGVKLSAGQLEIVNDFIVSKSPAFITELIAFQAKSTPYPAAFFNEAALRMDPVTWWKATKSSGVNSDFVDFVIRLLQAPASSASVERIFSNFGQIHSKIRNRLGNQTAGKLVFCFRLLRGDLEIDY